MDELPKPTDDITTWLDPASLENHPLNAEVYRDVPDDEFVESVRQHGILQPLLLAADAKTIVAGHRRRQAAVMSGRKEVPVRIRPDLFDDLDIRKTVLESNRNRTKTPEQIAREVAEWERIFDELADRKAAATKRTPHNDEYSPESGLYSVQRGVSSGNPAGKPAATGGLRHAAKQLGISTSTAEMARTVGRAIDEAEAAGDTELAAGIRTEKTVDGAYKVAKGKKKKSGGSKPRKKKEPPTVDNPAETLKSMATVIETERTKIDLVIAKFGPDAFAETALKDLDSGIIALRNWAQKFAKKEKK